MTNSKRRVSRWIAPCLAALLLGLWLSRGTDLKPSSETSSRPTGEIASPRVAENVGIPSVIEAKAASGKESSTSPAPAKDSVSSAAPVLDAQGAVEMKVHGRRVLEGGRPLDRNHPQVAKAMRIHKEHLDLMTVPGVIGTGVGLNQDGELAIVVYATQDGVEVPKTLGGMPVAIRRTGEFVARRGAPPQQAPDTREVKPRAGETSTADTFARPVPIGVSTGHPSITAGTIGCRVKDGENNVYALSNNHVYAAENTASVGEAVIQPGTYDGGSSPADDIGNLSAFVTINFGGSPMKPTNVVDAAIAMTSTQDLGTGTPANWAYGTPNSTTLDPQVGKAVQKMGRTTGHTKGTIDSIDTVVTVTYGSGRAYYYDQVVITPGGFSAGGDSGSLIVTDDDNRNPVGLLFAGSSSHTIANDINNVLAAFGVTVDDRVEAIIGTPPQVSISSPTGEAPYDSGSEITFSGSATDGEDGALTGQLNWYLDGGETPIGTGTGFSMIVQDGDHTVTASVDDSDGNRGSESVSFTVGTPTVATVVSVQSVSYATEGGKNADKHLLITVALGDNFGEAVSGATVAIAVDNTTNGSGASGSATTGSSGTVTFTWKNAPSGDYVTTVNNVSASGLEWDGVTPANGFTKP